MDYLSSRALAESILPSNPGLEPSPTVRSIPTASASCDHTWLAAGSIGRLSTEMCVLCQETRGLLTSSLAGSRARISALQESAEAWTASAPAFTGKSLDLSLSANPPTSFLKTSQQSEVTPGELSKIWPISGSIVGGQVSVLPKLAPLTSATEGGCLLPTPSASSYGSNQGGAAGRTGKVRHSLSSTASRGVWPTPTVCGNYNRKGASKSSGDGLATAVTKTSVSTGPLNPTWVEWLMGYPLGWTALEHSEMPSSLRKRALLSNI